MRAGMLSRGSLCGARETALGGLCAPPWWLELFIPRAAAFVAGTISDRRVTLT